MASIIDTCVMANETRWRRRACSFATSASAGAAPIGFRSLGRDGLVSGSALRLDGCDRLATQFAVQLPPILKNLTAGLGRSACSGYRKLQLVATQWQCYGL